MDDHMVCPRPASRLGEHLSPHSYYLHGEEGGQSHSLCSLESHVCGVRVIYGLPAQEIFNRE